MAIDMPYQGTSRKGILCPTGHLAQIALSGHNAAVENNVAAYRKQRGLSQTDLADKVGTTLNMLGKLERGDRTLDIEWLEKIGRALDVEPYQLIAPLDGPPPSLPSSIDDIAAEQGFVFLEELDLAL